MNATPVITKRDGASITWNTPTFPSLVTRTIEIYRGTNLYRTDSIQTSSVANIGNLETGTYKIRYKVNSNQDDFSAFSNEVQLFTEMSPTPSITSFEPRVKDDGFAVAIITGINGAYIVAKDVNDFDAASGTIYNTNGIVEIGISNGGTYTFVQREDGKNFSIKTAAITILPRENSCVTTYDIKIAGSGTEVSNSTRVYRTSYQGTAPTSVSWAVSGQGTQIISGGNANDAEIKIGSSGGTISVTFISCNGVSVTKDYIYDIGAVLPSCDNNGTTFSLGTITYDNTANTLYYGFNANNLSTANWNIKKGTAIVQSGSSTHNSNNRTIPSINTLAAGVYTFELIGSSCTGTATKQFTVVADPAGSLPSCNNVTSAFGIISIVHNATANTLTYQFNASGLGAADWKIKQGVAVLGSGSVTHTSNVKTISTPILITGGYTFELTGTTCDGIVTKAFNAVGNTTPDPPTPTPAGDLINVFVFVGESNAGTRNTKETLVVGEGGPRTGVRIWNNTLNKLEQLNVGVNNYQGENEKIEFGWGWEVQLANLRANNTIANDFIILKTAQGGALIGQYNEDIVNGYYQIMKARIEALKAVLKVENRTPVFYVMYSQGINNATTDGRLLTDTAHFPNKSGTEYWGLATTLLLANIRSLLGISTKISMTKFQGTYGDYLNGTITNLVNNSTFNSSIVTSDLGLQVDGLHFNASGTRTIVDRFMTALAPAATPPIVIPPVVPPTKKVTAMAKFSDTGGCATNLIQFGYSTSASIVPTNFLDSNATKRVVSNNGVISEVQTGGSIYQSRDFSLPTGTYHFFSRQKTLITNITYEGVITLTA